MAPVSAVSDTLPEPTNLATAGRPFRTLLRYNRRYWRQYLGGVGAGVVLTAGSLAGPQVVRQIIAMFETGTTTYAALALWVGLLLGLNVLQGLARFFQRMLMIRASRRFEYDLRNDFFGHVQKLSQRYFRRTPTGDLMARATSDMNYVREFVGPGIMYSVDLLMVPGALVLMLLISPWLTLMALVPLPFVFLLVYSFLRYLERQSKVVQAQYSRVTSRAQENLAGARVVKAFGMAQSENALFGEEAARYMRENVKLAMVMATALPVLGILAGSTLFLLIWQGGGLVIRGDLLLADLSAFLLYLLILAAPIAQFGWVLSLYQRGSVSMNRIAGIMSVTPEIADGPETNTDARVYAGHVRIENLRFAHEGARPAVDGVSLEIPAGTTLAIVGPTGSGKSTLAALLTREFDPDEGTVRIDGHELRTIPLRSLRAALGVVPQDSFIFSDTIRANICLGRPEASDVEVQAACDVAQFSADLAEMPDGLNTLLGERGINLSGGQKQRLAIARAVLCDPRILILDDALSSVDTRTEERILQGLRGVMAQRTSVVIAHRCSTIRFAHRIVVLEEGRITEEGTHAELLARGGHYAQMYHRQQLEAALEDEA